MALPLLFVASLLAAQALAGPNVVLVLTDDQDVVLDGTVPTKATQRLIAKRGITFSNSFTVSPVCCPSRASLLTGKYPHNHGTVNNSLSGGCSDLDWQTKHENRTFAALLNKRAGYATFYAGKYLNQYGEKSAGGPRHVPEGWTEWRGLIGNSKYYNFTLSVNGKPTRYNDGEYLTDVIKSDVLSFIDLQRENNFKNPFLIVAAPPAPHAPFTPAPKYENSFPNIKALRTPNFNIPANNKHWLLRMPPSPLSNSSVEKLDSIYRKRWQTLLSVDEMVEAIIKKLEAYKIIDDTYIIFTSDNGYHIGQFSQPYDKRQPYDSDIKVPFMIRGPNIKNDVRLKHPIANIDLAPTILKLAGIEDNSMDGLPLPIFEDTSMERSIETNEIVESEVYDRQILIEYKGEGSNNSSDACPLDDNLFGCMVEFDCKCQDSRNNSYNCIRHVHPMIDFIYCAFNDTEEFEEAYDFNDDSYQMNNIIADMLPAIKFKYQNTLNHLISCSGHNCNIYNGL